MSRRRLAVPIALAAVLAGAIAGACGAGPAAAHGVPLQTGLSLSGVESEATPNFAEAAQTGARFLKVVVHWWEVAPRVPPPGFNPANPEDPAYRWAAADRVISEVTAHGMIPVVEIDEPPGWAQIPAGAGDRAVDPVQLALFAHACAQRYDGSAPGLPQVTHWEVWNEPNATYFLEPQIVAGQVVSAAVYRTMLNDFAAAVHEVSPEEVVIGGNLFPNGFTHTGATAISPLEFTRLVFCLSKGPHPHRTCGEQVHADAWSVHPYTTGGPATLPASGENVWIANLGSLSTLAHAAQRLGALVSAQPVQLWVTEFSWDSNPPDPAGVPAALEQRWVAETLYRAWRAGYTVFQWYSVRDEPLHVSPQQSGLYFRCATGIGCDPPKPAFFSFRFPFVAVPSGRGRVLLWGRTPGGVPGAVQVQWLGGRRWRRLATLRTDGNGIFTARPRLPRRASRRSALLRAVLSGASRSALPPSLQQGPATSPAFSLHRPPDIIVNPLGS